MRKLIVLSDYGLDDAVATAHLLSRRDRIDSIDIIAVAGNVDAATSLRNAATLLAKLGAQGVRIVDTAALKQPWSQLPSIHGLDGMGDLWSAERGTTPVISYADYVRDLPENPTVLSLGPLTVTLDLLGRMIPQELVIMAGVVGAAPNFHGYEFNQYLDIPAFDAAVKHPHVIATLDTCRGKGCNMIDRKGETGGVLGTLIDRAIELAAARHPDNCYIYDYVAAQYVTDPDRFTVDTVTDRWGNVLRQLRVK